MPAKSEKQRRFFYLVKAIQQKKASPKQVGSKITKAAKSMSPKDVDDFTHGKNLPKKKLKEIIECIRGLKTDPRVDLRYDTTGNNNSSPIEPMYLENSDTDLNTNQEINPVAKTFKQQGNFEEYIQRFSGLEMKPKEIESIVNYTNSKPTKNDKFYVRYENTDDFGNTTITVIKKLREGNDLVFTTFQTTTSQNNEENEKDIIVNKSRSFRDEIEGGKILADILQKLEV